MTWTVRIAQARAAGGFTERDMNDAGSWVTCACGEQSQWISRRSNNSMPHDHRLFGLGLDFHDEVKRNLYDAAELTLGQIEQRATQLLSAK